MEEKINGEKTMDRKNTNVTFTDKEIKEEVLTLENYEVKDIDYDHGVYKSTLSLSTEDEQEEKKIIAQAYCFLVNGAEENIVEVADDESGDLFTVADVMVNDYKIDSGSSIAIIDYYYLYSSIATVESKKYLLTNFILPYFKDKGVDYVGFCNAGFEFTNDTRNQRTVDKALEETPIIFTKKTEGDEWKSTVNIIDLKNIDDYMLEKDYGLEEYEKEKGIELSDNFKEEYDKFIFEEDPKIADDVLAQIKDVYKFKKNLYYSEDGRRVNITTEDRKEMNRFQTIRGTFENIEELYDRVASSYKNLIKTSISQDMEINPNTIIGAFISDGNAFIDYLDQQWLERYVSNFKDNWKKICSYIYDSNLGYRLCYNLRDFDQHPQGHAARQVIKEIGEDVGTERIDYYLNVAGIFSDDKIKKKMKQDFLDLQENDLFTPYASNYMINLTILYNLALSQFVANNSEDIQEVYYYLVTHNFNERLIKSVDDYEFRITGEDYADDVITTFDVDYFLHRLEKKGIINAQVILDIRNGQEDTPDIRMASGDALKNVLKTHLLGR